MLVVLIGIDQGPQIERLCPAVILIVKANRVIDSIRA